MQFVEKRVTGRSSLVYCALVAVPFVVAFCLSPTALVALGYEYVVPGGNPFHKVHPGTYLATIALGIFAMTGSRPLLWRMLMGRDKLILYFIALFTLLAYAATFLSVPFATLVDTWYLPGIFVMMIAALSMPETLLLGRIVDVVMAANTLLGMVEFAKDWRLVPLTQWSGVLGQWVYPHEWRSTSLLGHPLTNSYITGTYMLAILLGGRFKSAAMRFAVLGFHTGGLIIFGSRGASVILGIAIVIHIFYHLARSTRTGTVHRDVLLYLGVGIPLLTLLVPAVLSSGVADKFIERFTVDKGSAETRGIALDIVASFPLSALLTGAPATLTFAILGRYNVIAVENFWLSFLLFYGLIGCALFFPAIFLLGRIITRHSTAISASLLVYFYACCSTSASLASKNLGLVFVTVICMTTYPGARKLKAAAVSRRGLSHRDPPDRFEPQPARVATSDPVGIAGQRT